MTSGGDIVFMQAQQGGGRTHLAFDDVLALSAPAPDRVIAYGDKPQQFGELWLPAGDGPHPLVVFIHGGCWLNAYDVGHSRPLAAALRAAGLAVWSLEYRRLGDPGGGWPGTFEDVAAGLDRVTELSAHQLDLGRLLLMGHSAGGQLALWAAARPLFGSRHPFYSRSSQPCRAVIGLAAIFDLQSYASGKSACERAALELLGGSLELAAERARWVSPACQALPEGSLLLQAADDRIVPPLSSPDAAIGLRVETLPGGHFDLIHPGSAAWPRVLAAVSAELE